MWWCKSQHPHCLGNKLVVHSKDCVGLFFSGQLTVNKFSLEICQWLYSNCRPLVLEATAQTTKLQPLPINFYSVRDPGFRTNFSKYLGSSSGSVGRAVDSYCRGPRFAIQSSVKFISSVYCELYWKMKNNEKKLGTAHSIFSSVGKYRFGPKEVYHIFISCGKKSIKNSFF